MRCAVLCCAEIEARAVLCRCTIPLWEWCAGGAAHEAVPKREACWRGSRTPNTTPAVEISIVAGRLRSMRSRQQAAGRKAPPGSADGTVQYQAVKYQKSNTTFCVPRFSIQLCPAWHMPAHSFLAMHSFVQCFTCCFVSQTITMPFPLPLHSKLVTGHGW